MTYHRSNLAAGILLLLTVSSAEDIVIRRTEPNTKSQEFPCPHQRVQYECATLRPVAQQTWILPSGVNLWFTGASSVGRIVNSSDDQFSATLTSKMEDEDPDSDALFFTSTLLIIDPVNGSELICSSTAASSRFQENTAVVLSGIPDPPTNVGYDESVVIESSVDLEWSRPSYTGSRGVSVMNYTISANGGTVVVSDDSEVVRYTSQSLIYGDVLVSAINSCGQESTRPELLNIPTSEPPAIAEQTVEMDCNTPLNDGRPVKITWMEGPREPGVVYPGEERVNVVLDPGNIACLNKIDNDMSCTATIKEDGVYRVKITRANEVGETVNDSFTFPFSVLSDGEDECSPPSKTNRFSRAAIVIIPLLVAIMAIVMILVILVIRKRRNKRNSIKPENVVLKNRNTDTERVHGDGGEGKEKESEVTDIRDDSLCKRSLQDPNIGEEGFIQEPDAPPLPPPYCPTPSPPPTPSTPDTPDIALQPLIVQVQPIEPAYSPEVGISQPPFVSREENRQSPATVPDATSTKIPESEYSMLSSQPAPSAGMKLASVKNASLPPALPTSPERAPAIPPRPPPLTTNTTVEQEGSKSSKPVIYTSVEISNPRHVLPPPEPHLPALHYATVCKPAP